MTSFLALPFLFPILIVLGIFALPALTAVGRNVYEFGRGVLFRDVYGLALFTERAIVASADFVYWTPYDIRTAYSKSFSGIVLGLSWVYTVLLVVLFGLPLALFTVGARALADFGEAIAESVSEYTSVPAGPAMRSLGRG